MTAAALGREVVVGLDVGTTAVKAVAVDPTSPWQYVAERDYPLLQPEPGQAVQDPATVLDAIDESLAETVSAAAGAEILAVSVSAAMHGLLGLDAAYRPVTRLVTWADGRSVDEARALRASGRGVELHRRSGTPVHPMSPLTKLMWFHRHQPEVCADVRWWVGLKELVLLHLTGTVATELSSASATGLLDLRSRGWDPTAVDLAGIAVDQLPPILSPTATLPLASSTARRVGLPAGTSVVAGGADGPLANVGAGAVAPGVVGLSLGTSGAVRAVVPEPHMDAGGRLFCYALTESTWVVGGAISNGGIVVRWAAGELGRPDATGTVSDEALLELAATASPGCDGLVMLPYLLPERAPLWDPDLRGAYLGLRREHTRAHLVRAAVEGVALQLAALAADVDRVRAVQSVRATGGAFRASLWRRVVAAALDRPIHVTTDAGGTAYGAVALALLALGRARTLDEAVAQLATVETPAERVEPEPELVAARQQVASSLPHLVDQLAPVADLFR